MANARERKLRSDSQGNLILPDPVPTNPDVLLELMNEASDHAGTATATGAEDFDHGIRVFNQLKAHCDLHIAREIAAAHLGLKQETGKLETATHALRVATWWLAGITVILGGIELWKMITEH